MSISPTQISLYNNLMSITQREDDTFFFKDFVACEHANTVYRIFNYRLASYTDFNQVDSLACRGIMFEVCMSEDKPLRLASRPMDKFFNYNENPFTIYDDVNLLLHSVNGVFVKEDGSLISSYIDTDLQLKLKSKGSISSDQCIAAMAWLEDFDLPIDGLMRQGLYDDMMYWTQQNYTVNAEWCSPVHRIVLPYNEGQLRILNIRNNETGEYLDLDLDIKTSDWGHYLSQFWVIEHNTIPKQYTVDVNNFDDVYRNIKASTGHEGYVVRLASSMVPPDKAQYFKVKTDWYCSLHHSKDSVNNARRLFECIMDDAADDLRQLFTGDKPEETDHNAIGLINAAEEKYSAIYNHLIAESELFYETNKQLVRREYAMKGQKELNNKLGIFNIVMNLYQQRPVDYKSHMKKQWKALGLRDENVIVDTE